MRQIGDALRGIWVFCAVPSLRRHVGRLIGAARLSFLITLEDERALRGHAMTTSEEIARAVVQARTAHAWSQRRLAEILGTSNTAVSRIESGRHGISLATLQRLADVLGIRFTIEPRRLQLPDIDRSEIRRAVRMSDHERETYYLASNRNMLRLFGDAICPR